jgi:hypothetical protein
MSHNPLSIHRRTFVIGAAAGAGAVWVKAKESPGTVSVTARHPYLGARTIQFELKPAPAEAL